MRIPGRSERPRTTSVVVLVASTVGFALVYAAGVLTRPGQIVENRALDASTYLDRPGGLLALVSPLNLAIALAVIALLGLALRRVRATVRGVAIVVVSTVLSQLLKNGLLARPDYLGDVSANTLPSGHTVAYASIVCALLVVLPTRPRTVAALVSSIVLGVVVVQLLEFGWHRASDVIAGLLLVVAVMALAQLLLPDRGPVPVRSSTGTRALLVLGAVIGVVLVVASVAFAATLALDRSLATTHTLLLASQVMCLAAVSLAVMTVLWVQRGVVAAAPRGRALATTPV
ncbi:phosphatase PAP2 family protein [Conyzicola lurida]|uniref:phosphatase PAP2 family protein n=1 Tax=Conyzicola lurida TaxID=1172621 RepID=UPI00161C05C4